MTVFKSSLKTVDEFETQDLGLAAYLYATGTKYIGIVEGPTRRKIFIFERLPEIEEVQQRFLNRELTIEPKLYHQALLTLKEFLYNR